MAVLGKNLKNILVKSMEAIGNTASSIASNTKYKVDEMNLLNRKREILNDFGAKAYAIWEKGENTVFPDELKKDLEELCRIDNQLVDMRAEHYSGQDNASSAAPEPDMLAEGTETQASEQTADPESDSFSDEISPEKHTEDSEQDSVESSSSSVADAINSLFDSVSSADTSAEKANDLNVPAEKTAEPFIDEADSLTQNSKE